jgi:peptidoglycan hydrolase-like protein with peptidoglycan-binding domain
LNDIDPSAGGALPKLVPDGQCGPKTRAAILHFQQAHLGLTQDSKVDPGGSTLREMNAILDPSLAAADPKTLALNDMVISNIWAQFALTAVNGLLVGNTAAALETHFHLSKGKLPQSVYLPIMKQNYQRVIAVFAKAAQVFRSRSDTQAKADQGVDKAGVPFPAYTFFQGSINFTSTFKPFDDSAGFGPLCRAAMVLHEPVHFVDQLANNANDIYEHSPQYANISPETAVHNPSSYVCFAEQIMFGSDVRFGAGKPAI